MKIVSRPFAYYSVIALVLPFAVAKATSGPTDLISCKREGVETRQFCFIKDEKFDLTLVQPENANFDGANFRLTELFGRPSITIASDGATNILNLRGLRPVARFEVDWSSHADCLTSALWRHNVFASILTSGSSGQAETSKVSIGLAQYSLAAGEPLQSSDETPTSIAFHVSLSIIDADYRSDVPLPHERIPSSCKMLLQDARLTYDAEAVNADSDYLKILAATTASNLAQAAVIHANYVDSQRGAQCAAYDLGQTLRKVEILGETDGWNNLSTPSREALKIALKKAGALGAFLGVSATGDELWNYFVSADVQSRLGILCAKGRVPDYTVAIDPFVRDGRVVNKEGYDNAQDFFRQQKNLTNILAAAWALAEASRVGSADGARLDWRLDHALYTYLEK